MIVSFWKFYTQIAKKGTLDKPFKTCRVPKLVV